MLKGAGKTLISTVGGASGPLYGTAFLKAAAAFAVEDAGREQAVAGLEAAAAGARALGRSVTGEKRMLDALLPAASAVRAALDGGDGLEEILAAASAAADTGVQATVHLLATKGRASYLGERSIGHQAPGPPRPHSCYEPCPRPSAPAEARPPSPPDSSPASGRSPTGSLPPAA